MESARLGRPSCFSAALADDICERLVEGESLRTICSAAGMPARSTVLRWVEADAGFRSAYLAARKVQLVLLGSQTDLLRQRLADAEGPWSARVSARDQLQAHLRRVGQLTPKRYVLAIGK